MPCYGNGGEGACLGEETLGLDEGGAWEACMSAWSKSAPEKPGANRAADSQPLCGFAPGLLPHVRHCVGFEVGRGVGWETKLGRW